MVQECVEAIYTLVAEAKQYPQTPYVGLVASLLGKWPYICQVVPGIVNTFQLMEDAIRTVFIPALFGRKPIQVTEELHHILGHGMKNANLGIRYEVTMADQLFETLASVRQLLMDSLVNGTDLVIESHWQYAIWQQQKCGKSNGRKSPGKNNSQLDNQKVTPLRYHHKRLAREFLELKVVLRSSHCRRDCMQQLVK